MTNEYKFQADVKFVLPWKALNNSNHCKQPTLLVGCIAQLAERRSLVGELTLSYARPAADG